MTHQILTRFFVASLILLGEGAFVSEVNSRSDVAAAAIGNTVQSLPAVFLDDPELESKLVLTHLYLTPASSPLANKVLEHFTSLAFEAIEYAPANPRAPPVPV